MRISDWSSDVCSSDLLADAGDGQPSRGGGGRRGGRRHVGVGLSIPPVRHRDRVQELVVGVDSVLLPRRSRLLCLTPQRAPSAQIGRGQCRESGGPYRKLSGGATYRKTKRITRKINIKKP